MRDKLGVWKDEKGGQEPDDRENHLHVDLGPCVGVAVTASGPGYDHPPPLQTDGEQGEHDHVTGQVLEHHDHDHIIIVSWSGIPGAWAGGSTWRGRGASCGRGARTGTWGAWGWAGAAPPAPRSARSTGWGSRGTNASCKSESMNYENRTIEPILAQCLCL